MFDIRKSCKSLKVTNTLAYLPGMVVRKKNSYVTLSSDRFIHRPVKTGHTKKYPKSYQGGVGGGGNVTDVINNVIS
jgi:hypothetical protein